MKIANKIKDLRGDMVMANHDDFPEFLKEKIEETPTKPTKVLVGVVPKKKHKNKLVQWLLVKLFGYKCEYKTAQAKTIEVKAKDVPLTSFNGDITFCWDGDSNEKEL
jgi:hypothetical protein